MSDTRAAFEVNFDGLVGPTHNYAGLSPGNLASAANRHALSNPRRAALEGLAKMEWLVHRGLRQGLLPPHERPDVAALRARGFSGSDAEVLGSARRRAPELLAAVCSSSPMWAANAATVTPSADAGDGRVHLTPANLASNFHRSIEAATTGRLLRAIFPDERRFVVHPPLDRASLPDEGAANHTRFCARHGAPGFHLFVFGRSSAGGLPAPVRFPARHTLEASRAIAAAHALSPARTCLLQQNPAAIDAGAFHNDVVAVGNEDVHLFHEEAFLGGAAAAARVAELAAGVIGRPLRCIVIPAHQIGLADAVRSYVFNSQLVTMADGSMALLAPEESATVANVGRFLERLVEDGQTPIREVIYFALAESMRNGGGPACLRLRVVLNEGELAGVHPGALLDEARCRALRSWIGRHYRDRLAPDDLADPQLLDESRTALDELTGLLGLGAFYPFQRASGQ